MPNVEAQEYRLFPLLWIEAMTQPYKSPESAD